MDYRTLDTEVKVVFGSTKNSNFPLNSLFSSERLIFPLLKISFPPLEWWLLTDYNAIILLKETLDLSSFSLNSVFLLHTSNKSKKKTKH